MSSANLYLVRSIYEAWGRGQLKTVRLEADTIDGDVELEREPLLVVMPVPQRTTIHIKPPGRG